MSGQPRPPADRGAPLIAHVLRRIDYGGVEHGVETLLRHLPRDEFRHAVIQLADADDAGRLRAAWPDVDMYTVRESRTGLRAQLRILRLLRQLQPALVHTRNAPAIGYQAAAAIAGVPARIHSEHGRDTDDLDGTNWRLVALRRIVRPFVHHHIALSRELERYLLRKVGVDASHVTQIYNGVDTERFRPHGSGARAPLPVEDFVAPDSIVIGTVGRMDPVKDPLTLAEAFARLAWMIPEARSRLRLVMIGDGSERAAVEARLERHGLREQAWLPGAREDVPALLQGFDIFVLSSLSEGISNTILEAMATRLPVVATAVGGNPELVTEGETGALVRRADPEALARALLDYVRQPAVRLAHGRRALRVVREQFGLPVMVGRYAQLYRNMIAEHMPHRGVGHPAGLGPL